MAVDCVNHIFQLKSNEFTVKRTGHARFRRAPFTGPSISSQSEQKQLHAPPMCSISGDVNGPSTSSQSDEKHEQKQQHAPSSSLSTSASSIVSSLPGVNGFEETVSNGKSLGIIAPAPTFSSRKPPLPSTHRKRCSADRPVIASVHRSGNTCHCCKKRKTGLKREIRKVPIIGSKITSIPADDYSWKKYGEKKIDGSRYPKVYYKCSTGKGCPARKRVELSMNDSKMLIVTYDGEHRHCHAPAPTPVPMSFSLVKV